LSDAEKVSEMRSRGRPKAWHHAAAATFDSLSNAKTARGRQNFRLAALGQHALSKHWEPAFAWFWHSGPIPTYDELHAKVMDQGPNRLDWRMGVLVELGRIVDDRELLGVAREIAALPLDTTTTAAARAVRRYRLGEKSGNALDLARAMANAVDEYRMRFPKTGDDTVMMAIRKLVEAVQGNA
jgi:hypothetical protein